jgi:hypothetical protein
MTFYIQYNSKKETLPVTSYYDSSLYELQLDFNSDVLNAKMGSQLTYTVVASAETINTDFTISVILSPLLWTDDDCKTAVLVDPKYDEVV